MKTGHAVILALALFLGANAHPNPTPTKYQVLEARLRTFLAPGFRTELDDAVKRLLETKVRDIIKNGDEDLGLPVLDPLKVEHLDININQDGLRIEGSVDKVVITGAADFKVDNVKTDLEKLSADVDISLDAARLEGEHYKLEGDILNGALPVEGEGRFEADLKKLGLKVKLELGVKAEGDLEVKKLELDVSLGEGKVNFENLLGGGTLGDIANDFISSELPGLVDSNKGPILEDIAVKIRSIANEKLVGVTLEDLLDLINNSK